MEMLLVIGARIALFMASPVSALVGAAVPVAAGLRAVYDLASGRVQLKRADETDLESVNERRDALRKRIVGTCVAQIIIAIVSLSLITWIYVFDEIRKDESGPQPDWPQSVGLIAILLMTVVAIFLELRRLFLSSKIDKAI